MKYICHLQAIPLIRILHCVNFYFTNCIFTLQIEMCRTLLAIIANSELKIGLEFYCN